MRGSGLPQSIRSAVESRLGPLARVDRVGGGCIDPAARLEFTDGRRAFLKWSSGPTPDRYGVEARGLQALAERGGLAVPRVLGHSGDGAGKEDDAPPETDRPILSWLLLDWIEPGGPSEAANRALGAGLATLHRPYPEGTSAGWQEEGWIATLSQRNVPSPSWPTFWFRERLAPQWERARRSSALPASADSDFQELEWTLQDVLSGWEADGICLLHGDLWAGNVLVSADGVPHLVDPAVYRGHREVDLAMLELFGSPGPSFFEAYQEIRPLAPGLGRRLPVYQLYPLLVHVNLFGGGYRSQALHCLRAILR